MDRDRLQAMGPALRLAGMALLAVAGLAAARLLGHPEVVRHGAPPLDYLLALATFAGGAAGFALTVLGPHLFDEVALSERWSRRPPRESGTMSEAAMPVAAPAEAALPFVMSALRERTGGPAMHPSLRRPQPASPWVTERIGTRH